MAGRAHRFFWIVVALCAAALGGVLYVLLLSVSKPESGEGLMRFAVGEMAALRVLEEAPVQTGHPFFDEAGARHTLADFRGQVVVFSLWATWCPPCRAEMPMLARLAQLLPGRDAVVVLVNVDVEADAQKAREQFAELVGDALPYYRDPRAAMQFTIRSPGLPTTIVFDRQGREAARLAGAAEWDSDEAMALIEAVVGD